MTSSKKLILQVLKIIDSQTLKIKIITELTDQVICEGFLKAFKDFGDQP
jgi:hypothetical protein